MRQWEKKPLLVWLFHFCLFSYSMEVHLELGPSDWRESIYGNIMMKVRTSGNTSFMGSLDDQMYMLLEREMLII